MLGLAEITIRQYESNKREPKLGIIQKIATALERVKELTEIKRYTEPDEPQHYVNAAHAIPGASEEDKQHDEDIMDDENF